MLRDTVLTSDVISTPEIQIDREWLADGQICRYRLCSSERAWMDAWIDDVSRIMRSWPVERPWRLLVDLRAVTVVAGAYGLSQGRTIARLRPDLPGRVAILATDTFTTRLTSIALRALPNDYRQRRLFADEAAAVAWLLRDGTITPS